jgi:multiple sugar transport system substrate-binding protein
MSRTIRKVAVSAVGVVLLAAPLAGCGGGSNSTSASAGAATSTDGWTRTYDGTTLNVIGEATANTQILEKLLPDFTTKTGITVKIEQAPYDSLVQKAVLDFTTKKANYDVLSIPYEYLGAFAEKQYIAQQDGFVTSPPAGLGADFSAKDVIPSLWKASSNWKDHWYGMPSNSAVMMMFYRKDLFADPTEQAAFKAKYGYALAPAKTWKQYQDIGEFFTRAAGTKLAGQTISQPFYGLTLAGKRHVATVLEWMNYSWTNGGDLFDSSGQPVIASAANVAALTYEKGLTAFAPPGYTSATWDEVTAQLQQGTAAEAITWGDTAGAMEDKAQSKVLGKMGYADIPTTAEGDKPEAHLGSWTYSVNADSKNQEAAQVFMAWALSKGVQTQMAQQGGLPALTSTFQDSTLVSSLPYWTQELTSLNQSRSRPRIPQWGGISDALALDISKALSGQATAEEALKDAQQKVVSLMAGALPVTYQ